MKHFSYTTHKRE